MALCLIAKNHAELWPFEVLHCGNGYFRPFCSCDPRNMNLTRIPWRYRMRKWNTRIFQFESYLILCKLVHVVTRGHLRSRVTKMAVTPFQQPYPKTPCYTQTSWLYVLWNRNYGRWKFYIAREWEFSTFFVPVTLQWPSPDDLHKRTWPVFPGNIPDVQIWTY